MSEDTSLRGKVLRPTWLETMAPNIKRFEVAAAFGGTASWNSVGSAAMAELIKTMAKLIDEEVGRRDAKDRRIEALEAALKRLLDRDERNTCQHEDTHRGGFLWTICDGCGAKWADDEGGKPDWQDPQEWVQARAALSGKGERQ